MIKIKTAKNTSANIGEICVKTAENKLSKIGQGYRVCGTNEAKSLKRIYQAPAPEHVCNYVQTAYVPSTCGSRGWAVYTCTICGDEYIEHFGTSSCEYVAKTTVDATCSEDGYVVWECKHCGDTYTEITSSATGNHVLEWVNYAESGGTDDSVHRQVCTICGWKSEELHDCAHETITDASCTEDGESKCTVCGHSWTIPAAGHSEYLNPYYEHSTHHEYVCSKCGEHIRYEAHKKGEFIRIVHSVCGETDGYSEYYCAVCGNAFKTDDVISEDSHNYQYVANESKARTCTEDGWLAYTCTHCGYSYKVTLPALGHDYVECIPNGNRTHKKICANCYDEITETCTEQLNTHYEHASNHEYICSVCGGHVRYEAHKKGEPTGNSQSAICGERDGWTEYYCAVCGNAFKTDDVIANDSHDEELIDYVEPTCTNEGYKEYLCRDCGHRRTETVPATGEHKEILNQDYAHPTNHEYICSVCGEHTRYEYHTKGKLVEVVSPICGERDGYSEYYCSKCGNAFKTDYVTAEDSHYDIYYEAYGPINGEYGRHKATCGVCGLEWDEECTPNDFGICTSCGESVM